MAICFAPLFLPRIFLGSGGLLSLAFWSPIFAPVVGLGLQDLFRIRCGQAIRHVVARCLLTASSFGSAGFLCFIRVLYFLPRLLFFFFNRYGFLFSRALLHSIAMVLEGLYFFTCSLG